VWGEFYGEVFGEVVGRAGVNGGKPLQGLHIGLVHYGTVFTHDADSVLLARSSGVKIDKIVWAIRPSRKSAVTVGDPLE